MRHPLLAAWLLAALGVSCSQGEWGFPGGRPCAAEGGCPFPFSCEATSLTCVYCPTCVGRAVNGPPADAGARPDASVQADASAQVDGPRSDGPPPDAPSGSGTWRAMSDTNAPGARWKHSAVFTGREVLIWGGVVGPAGNLPADSAVYTYNLATDTWRVGAGAQEEARNGHVALWLGTQMLIVGGPSADGLLYSPDADRWARTSPMPGGPRFGLTAVLAGADRVLVHGGTQMPSAVLTYTPTLNAWTEGALAPYAATGPSAAWTGSEMLVFGGDSGAGQAGPWSYAPATDTWTPLPRAGQVSNRAETSVLWAAERFVVVGGNAPRGRDGIFDPAMGMWLPASIDAIAPRPVLGFDGTSVWAYESAAAVTALHAIDPLTGQARMGNLTGAPLARTGAAGVWTGSELVVWGGAAPQDGTVHASGARFTP